MPRRERVWNARPRVGHGVLYPLAGAVVATGAPLGLLVLRSLVNGGRRLREDIGADRVTYLYLTIATPLVFAALGRIVGRYAEQLAALSVTDPLTGLANWRLFQERLDRELERSERSGAPLSLLAVDLDRLKHVNDTRGHAAGDRALVEVADAIRQQIRTIDLAARVGGDEFAVVAAGATEPQAYALATRILQAVRDRGREVGLPTTVSIGLATLDPSQPWWAGRHLLMQAADRALYQAKQAGRNRITIAEAGHRRYGRREESMTGDRSNTRVLRAPLADLEQALIDTFVHARGYDAAGLAALPPAEREALLREASVFASSKLAEVEARSRYLHEIHE